MTKSSIDALQSFLDKYENSFSSNMRVADYGGTESLDSQYVIKRLARVGLKNYSMLDFDNGFDLRKPLKVKFDLGICMDLLEHTSNPFVVANNIVNSLKRNSFLFVTVPFVWAIHNFPKDYWRFTPDGLKELFKRMKVESCYGIVDDYTDDDLDFHGVPVSFPFSRVVGVFKKK